MKPFKTLCYASLALPTLLLPSDAYQFNSNPNIKKAEDTNPQILEQVNHMLASNNAEGDETTSNQGRQLLSSAGTISVVIDAKDGTLRTYPVSWAATLNDLKNDRDLRYYLARRGFKEGHYTFQKCGAISDTARIIDIIKLCVQPIKKVHIITPPKVTPAKVYNIPQITITPPKVTPPKFNHPKVKPPKATFRISQGKVRMINHEGSGRLLSINRDLSFNDEHGQPNVNAFLKKFKDYVFLQLNEEESSLCNSPYEHCLLDVDMDQQRIVWFTLYIWNGAVTHDTIHIPGNKEFTIEVGGGIRLKEPGKFARYIGASEANYMIAKLG